MAESSKEVKEVACVVCGQKSHRLDWQGAKAPACDSHSKEEIAKATAPKPSEVVKGPIPNGKS